jgi:hypothetical protein
VLNGTKWTSVTLTKNSYHGLSAISCVSVKSCLAVGASGQGLALDSGRAFAISWNGKTWKPLAVPIPPHGGGKGNGSGFLQRHLLVRGELRRDRICRLSCRHHRLLLLRHLER